MRRSRSRCPPGKYRRERSGHSSGPVRRNRFPTRSAFCWPSPQVLQMRPAQSWFEQSESEAQLSPGPQRRHWRSVPPQSMSVSLPFRAPSGHVIARHTPARQSSLWQSSSIEQPAPSSHATHAGLPPPQSMLVSVPFRLPSAHEMQTPASHAPLAQSLAARHVSRSGQALALRVAAAAIDSRLITAGQAVAASALAALTRAAEAARAVGFDRARRARRAAGTLVTAAVGEHLVAVQRAVLARAVGAQRRSRARRTNRSGSPRPARTPAPAPHAVGQPPPQSRSDSS